MRSVQTLFRRVGSFFGQAPDLGQISAAIHHGCMGLPQELVDYIMEMLYDDICALKACSLTCKAMFASARHLVHHTLYLTPQSNPGVLTQQEKSRYQGRYRLDTELRSLSYVGEQGFLRYTRHVHIRGFQLFTPGTPLPHLRHFQCFDRVHTLTIDHYDTDYLESRYKSCLTHFYPTLTSLTLRRPFGHCQPVLQFALQFPNLENLSVEWPDVNCVPRGVTVPAVIAKFPPLRGHLRLVGLGLTPRWSAALIHEFRNGVDFRSVEIEESSAGYAQDILNACAGTIESLTLVSRGFGMCQISSPLCPWRNDWLILRQDRNGCVP